MRKARLWRLGAAACLGKAFVPGAPAPERAVKPQRGSARWPACQRPRSERSAWPWPSPEVKAPGVQDKDFNTLLLAQFPVFVAVGALIPVLPLYGQEFGLSQSSVGLLVSSPSLAKLLLNVPFGQLADSIGRRMLMVGGMVLCAVGDVGTGLATSLPFLILARLLLGAGLSSSDAGASAWVADATESRADSRASFLGVQNAVIALAFVIGPAVGGWLVGEFGLRSIFFAVAAGATACAGGYALLPELKVKTSSEEKVSFQELIKAPEQQALACISVAFYAGTACKISLLPSVAAEAFGASPAEVGQLFSALAALAIFGTLVGGRIADAVGPRPVLVVCGSVCALAYFGAAVATEMRIKESFVACLALWALAAAVKSPALQAFAISAAPEDQRGAALSVPKTVGDLSYLLAPFLLGVLDDNLGPEAALTCCATTFLLGTVLFAIRSSDSDRGG
ncbi:unnamed protein product [Effrenium voratum]|uniref:Major facilitator superfamily (MFS) profile domain-containing protein n=1 Tax=Effrenium voratum TaxID=2562239 RepID=A0AA36ILR4_9DINO|nr:unnamed protein product [Effrenium voratum]